MAEQGFEASLQALEERVKRLESGEIPLDESLKLFEESVRLASQCHSFLDEAEQRIAALSRGTSGVEETALDEPER